MSDKMFGVPSSSAKWLDLALVGRCKNLHLGVAGRDPRLGVLGGSSSGNGTSCRAVAMSGGGHSVSSKRKKKHMLRNLAPSRRSAVLAAFSDRRIRSASKARE